MTALPIPSTPAPLRRLDAAELSEAARRACDTSPQEIISRWLAGLSEAAVWKYRQSLRGFAAWALERADERPETALRLLVEAGCGPAHEMVAAWRDWLLGKGLAPSTVAGQVTGLASLVKACRRAGLVAWRLEGLAPRPEKREDRSGPPRHEVERLVACLDDRAAAGDPKAIRDAAIVRLLHNAGMRRGEVVGLRFPEDVQLDAQDGPTVRPKRKGKREREPVLIGKRAGDALAAWVQVRGPEPGPLLFRLDRARGGARTPLTGDAVRIMLRARAAQAGLRSPCRPHGLRHSAATSVAHRGTLAELMAMGGWSSLSAAQNYLDRRAEERQRAVSMVEV